MKFKYGLETFLGVFLHLKIVLKNNSVIYLLYKKRDVSSIIFQKNGGYPCFSRKSFVMLSCHYEYEATDVSQSLF